MNGQVGPATANHVVVFVSQVVSVRLIRGGSIS